MSKSLLKTKSLPIARNGRDYNAINGNDAEIFTASKMLMALGAEISWGSRNEDSRKIDLIASFDHPWFNKERMLLLIQVKSGRSYGEIISDGFILHQQAVLLAQRTTHSICVIWVDRNKGKAFWAYIHPLSLRKGLKYGSNHMISPSMRFDLAKCQTSNLPIKVGGAGVIISESNKDLAKSRAEALQKYKKISASGILCPFLGKIEFTRIGWRHMFRKTRSKYHKFTSLNLIGYIDKILSDIPSKNYITSLDHSTKSEYEYRNTEYVLHYNQVKRYNRIKGDLEDISVFVRIIEEIRYPIDWSNKGNLSQLVERRVVLLSCYYK